MSESIRPALDPDQWITNYADLLFRYVYLRLGDGSTSEDIVQETFLSAWRSRETYNQSSSEKNWLFTICKNKLIDHYRKLRPGMLKQAGDNAVGYYFDMNDHWTDEAEPTAWNVSGLPHNSEDFFKVLNHCRSKLNKAQHAVFTMRYMDDLETKEICRLMGITIQNYWILIHRAKLQLRECLQRNWIDV
jgi:RNA polymerase sigma-70 factor (TIGR02943 family)